MSHALRIKIQEQMGHWIQHFIRVAKIDTGLPGSCSAVHQKWGLPSGTGQGFKDENPHTYNAMQEPNKCPSIKTDSKQKKKSTRFRGQTHSYFIRV